MSLAAADPRRFLYRMLDPDGARTLAARHLAAHDDGELYLQYAASEAFGFDDGRLKTADFHTSSGFGLRAVSGETTAFAHANDDRQRDYRVLQQQMRRATPRTIYWLVSILSLAWIAALGAAGTERLRRRDIT